jgi:hypothetical protein
MHAENSGHYLAEKRLLQYLKPSAVPEKHLPFRKVVVEIERAVHWSPLG